MRGTELRKAVDGSGLKPQIVYERAGYLREHYYKILQKRSVTVDELVRIATACGVKPGDMIESSTTDLLPLLPIAKELRESGLHATDREQMIPYLVVAVRILASWRRHEPVTISNGSIADPHLRNNSLDLADGRGGAVGLVRPAAANTTHARAA